MSDHENIVHDYLTGKHDDLEAVLAEFHEAPQPDAATARARWDALVSSRADEIPTGKLIVMPRHAARPTGFQRLITAVAQNPALLVAFGALGGIAVSTAVAVIVRVAS